MASLQMETGDGFTLESVLGTEGMEEAIVEREALRGAVAALPERERQVILLRYFRGMTQDRTAKVLGSLPGAGLPHRAQGHGASAPQAGVGAASLAPLGQSPSAHIGPSCAELTHLPCCPFDNCFLVMPPAGPF